MYHSAMAGPLAWLMTEGPSSSHGGAVHVVCDSGAFRWQQQSLCVVGDGEAVPNVRHTQDGEPVCVVGCGRAVSVVCDGGVLPFG
jgi:hypothetical protein